MDVLAKNICGSTHLKCVELVIVGHQIRVPVFDDVPGVPAEEERLGLAAARRISELKLERGRNVTPQVEHALLRIFPSTFFSAYFLFHPPPLLPPQSSIPNPI